ncbi:hypothetical protein Poli38472_009251 [Pythium oligandrum]|uniref:tRNA threonylcarbamoyladenosine biosynthesis protein TsaE n=1 Tax=Pythium oligandrum TaxID=41045 RepID=A0A8K1FLB2_PYTOL|nr:hypothetical protein Poli38472_009251 [Pythium oligandrum]|eukprot:TMW65084.1 hypothetical protein Poli38472_009251 [Pythium oligandrum]
MEALGARLAHKRSKGDVIFLRGDLGCGKTCLARGFVRAMVRDTALQVTSPTYLLVNTYEAVDSVIHHVDLYRLEKVSDVDAMALGLTDAFANGISLVEWPQRLQTQGVPAERLEVSIDYDQETESTTRHVSFHSFGKRWEGFVLD